LIVTVSVTATDSIKILGITTSYGITTHSATSFTFTATIPVINAALSQGISWDPDGSSTTGTLVVTVNDQGVTGNGPLTTTHTTSINVVIQSDSIAGGFFGLTSLMSMGVFGVYKLLKKKKVIPEEADPWENDELFNATLDNPLFAGSPTTMEPIFE